MLAGGAAAIFNCKLHLNSQNLLLSLSGGHLDSGIISRGSVLFVQAATQIKKTISVSYFFIVLVYHPPE